MAYGSTKEGKGSFRRSGSGYSEGWEKAYNGKGKAKNASKGSSTGRTKYVYDSKLKKLVKVSP